MKLAKRTLTKAQLQELLIHCAPRLHRYAAKRIPPRFRSTITADDVLQEVWISAFKGCASFRADKPDAFDRWMNTLVDRKVIDACRAARTLKRGGDRLAAQRPQALGSSVEDFFHQIVANQPTPSREFSVIEAQHAVRIAIGALPEERRKAIWLHHIEGRPVAEVAKHLGKSGSAVNSLLYNGLRQLRLRLGRASRFFSDAQES